MRRDAVRQLRTVAGHQAAATPQEEAAGIGGGQEAAKTRPSTHRPRTAVVLRDAVVRHDRGRLRFRAAVPGAVVRGPGRVHAARRLRTGTGAVHDGAPRTAGRPVQLHVELVPGGLHQRRVQLQSHLRDVLDGRRWARRRRRRPARWTWRRRRRYRRGRRRRHSRSLSRDNCRVHRRQRPSPTRPGGGTIGEHQGLRVSAGRGLFQFHQVVRGAGRYVPVPLFPAQSHAGCGRLRQTSAVRRHRPLLRRAVHRLRGHVHRALRHALRLSVGGHGTTGTVQKFRGTFASRRRLQVYAHMYIYIYIRTRSEIAERF